MALSVVLFFLWENRKTIKAESKSEKILSKADRKRDHIIDDARKDSDSMVYEAKQEAHDIMKKAQHTEDRIAKTEARVIEREEKIEQRLDQMGIKQDEILAQEEALVAKNAEFKERNEELDGKLSELAKLTEAEAKDIYLSQIGAKYESDAIALVEKHKKKIEKQKTEISREILLKSIQQYAGDVTSEVTTTIIPIPSDDIK
jgi:ribonuclease Y